MVMQRRPGYSQDAGKSFASTGDHLDNVLLYECQYTLQPYTEGAHGQGALGDFVERD